MTEKCSNLYSPACQKTSFDIRRNGSSTVIKCTDNQRPNYPQPGPSAKRRYNHNNNKGHCCGALSVINHETLMYNVPYIKNATTMRYVNYTIEKERKKERKEERKKDR